jgi:sucrose phosphorylase
VHSLFGSHNDREGYERSGWKRDLNHQRLELDALELALADRSSETARVFGRITALLEARRSSRAFHPASPQRVLRAAPPVLAVQRGPWEGDTVLALHNLGSQPVEVGKELLPGAALDLLSGRTVAAETRLLAPYEALWLRLPSPLRGG